MTVYRVRGMEELFSAFLAFPIEFQNKALGSALRLGAELFLREAIMRAPVRTGNLQGNIVMVKDRKPELSGMQVRYAVFVAWKGPQAAKYWRFVEFGTVKQPPRPYMRPAFEIQKVAALAVIIHSLSEAIPRIAATVSK